ncbi:MAG TPA: hypothetical protein VGL77_01805 [Armatimonadota bacterium]|jgi:hypothetical protein
MAAFPRTTVGGVSLSRMIIGTNWFLGWSHTTAAKDSFIRDNIRDPNRIADILEVFFRAGIDTIMGLIDHDPLYEGIRIAEDRTGVKGILVSTPGVPVNAQTPEQGFDLDAAKRIFDFQMERGAVFCMPHQGTTDAMVDRCTRKVRHMDTLCALIRERGMIPGLSTHMPESIVYADESGLDVESYVALYNANGFLMQVEVDWVARIIHAAKKPVMTIKPMAAGQIRPFQAMHFVWNSLRPQDMVTVGTMTPLEAQELIDMSLGILEGREVQMTLQETRSKSSVKTQA